MPTARPLDVYMDRVLAEHPDWDAAQVRRAALTLLRRKAARARWDARSNGAADPNANWEEAAYADAAPASTLTRPDQVRVMVAEGTPPAAAEARMDDAVRQLFYRIGDELKAGVDGRRPLLESIDRAGALLEVARVWAAE